MFRFSRCIIFLAFAASLLYSFAADAAIISPTSCSSTDVQNAINAAGSGDTVIVLAGSCTWTSTVRISGKSITLQGAGIDQTNITDMGSGGAALIADVSAANFVTVTGITFIRGIDHSDGMILFKGTSTQIGFRFHHNKVTYSAASSTRGVVVENGYGLIDHNSFIFTGGSGSVQSVAIRGDLDESDGGFTSWKRPLTLGTNNAVYIEDNTFTYSSQDEDSIDAYSGARLVIRHNTFNNISVGFHGTDSGNRRSAHSYEIYSNTFTNNSGTYLRGATLRGGTGVIYSNFYGGSTSWYGITLMSYRSCPPADQSDWGTCDGTNYMLESMDLSDDGSRTCCTSGSGCNVKFCSNARDMLCTSDSQCPGGTCSTYFDGSGPSGYPCRDQVGITTNQLPSPLYVWANGSMSVEPYDGGTGCNINSIIMLNRDYYVNTAKPGYTAYTYPHPLSTDTLILLAPPTNLRVIQ